MITVRTILAEKGSQVWFVPRNATVLQAAIIMNEHRVGAVVVLEDSGVVGIFTERDVLRRVVAEGRDPATTPVGEVMTEQIICCTPETTMEEACGAMKNRRIRHLPVVDGGGQLVGLVSIGDFNARQATDQERTIHQLHEYLYGRV
jgi:CBS domain-containing protein